jgi:hypothetical protein
MVNRNLGFNVKKLLKVSKDLMPRLRGGKK